MCYSAIQQTYQQISQSSSRFDQARLCENLTFNTVKATPLISPHVPHS